MKTIPVAGPWITDLEIEYVRNAVTHAWYDAAGEQVRTFEHDFAHYVGRAQGVALPSCTSAIHLTLSALDIGPGDEVIVPDITWIATSAPVSYVGATTVFADVDPKSMCLTPETVAACLTERTRAIIAVDLYGEMPDLSALEALAADAGVELIEDAAEAVGSVLQGRHAGSFGRVSVFSFHGSKTLTTGEGGMLVTDDPDLTARINVLRDHGRVPGDRAFDNSLVAYKYKMSDLQAALGLAQLHRIDDLVDRKRSIWQWYDERLSDQRGLSLCRSDNAEVVWWMSTIMLADDGRLDKDRLQARMLECGVDSRPVFRPLSSLAAYGDNPEAAVAQRRNQNAYKVSPLGLNLPSALNLAEEDIDRVCRDVIRIVDSAQS